MNINELIALKESLTKQKQKDKKYTINYRDFGPKWEIFTEQEIRERLKTDIEKVIPLLEDNFEAAIRFLTDKKGYDSMNLPLYLGEFVVVDKETSEPNYPLESLEDFVCIEFTQAININLNKETVACEDITQAVNYKIPNFDDKTKLFVSRSALIAKLEENGYNVAQQNSDIEIHTILDFKKKTLTPRDSI